MSSRYDLELFRGTADAYAVHRPKYPQAAFDFLSSRFALDERARVLDLGCGTGNASLPLASRVGEVVALDPDPEMIETGRRVAAQQGIHNVRWVNQGSLDLSPELGRFRLVVMGQSFHWMERDQVLGDLQELVEEGGGLAFLGPAHGVVLVGNAPPQPRESWEDAADAMLRKYVGERRRHARSNPREPRHEPALLRSQFSIAAYHEFDSTITLSPDAIIGRLYSLSGNLREQLADRRHEFERELREVLLALWPEGTWEERLRTGVLVAVR